MQKRKSRERTYAVAVRYFPRFFRVPRIMAASGARALVKWAQRMLTIITHIHTTPYDRLQGTARNRGRSSLAFLSSWLAYIYIYRFSFRSFFRFPGKRRLRYTVSSRRGSHLPMIYRPGCDAGKHIRCRDIEGERLWISRISLADIQLQFALLSTISIKKIGKTINIYII